MGTLSPMVIEKIIRTFDGVVTKRRALMVVVMVVLRWESVVDWGGLEKGLGVIG